MEKKYNLTTEEGFKEAMEIFDKYGWIFPAAWLLKKGLEKILSPEISTEKQAEAARLLIIAGREQGVKKMQIDVDHGVGIDFGSNVEGIPIKLKVGNSGKMHILVEYK